MEIGKADLGRWSGVKSALAAVEEKAYNDGWESAQEMLVETQKRVNMLEKIVEQAHGLISTAENNKSELVCEHAHCTGRQHLYPQMNARAIGPQDWKDAQKTWMDS